MSMHTNRNASIRTGAPVPAVRVCLLSLLLPC